MFALTAFRVLRFAWQGFWRNFWLSLVTVSIIALAVLSVNALVVVNGLARTAVDAVRARIDLSFYFGPTATEAKVLEAKAFLASLPEVANVEYVSPAQALDRFLDKHRNDPLARAALELLGSNPFGAALVVRANSLEQYEVVISRMANSKFQELVADKDYEDYRQYTGTISAVAERIQLAGAAAAAVFAAIALLIVFNAIRVTIYTQREEIAIMRLVGASNWFIRWPYLIEAVFYALLGCVLAYALTVPLLKLLQPHVARFFEGVAVDVAASFRNQALPLIAAQVAVISLLNIASSALAIRRYLRR